MNPVRIQVVIYSRASCHLCEEAEQTLRDATDSVPLELTKIDVDTDPVLIARYGDSVPVVTINGQVRFRGRVDSVLLKRHLHALSESGS